MSSSRTKTIFTSNVMRCRASMSFALTVLVLLISVQPASIAQGQQRSYFGCCPPPIQLRQVEPPPLRVRRTYGGRVYYSFPNYDIVLSGAPQNLADLVQGNVPGAIPGGDLTVGNLAERVQRSESGTVIFKDEEGMRWDGSGFFLHPAYPIEDATRYRYTNRIVGDPQRQWPEDVTEPLLDDRRERIRSVPSEPIVTQLEPTVPTMPTYAIPYRDTTTFLPQPWVVEPAVTPSTEPTPPQKSPVSPSATSSSSTTTASTTTTTTTTTTAAQEIPSQVKTAPVPSYKQAYDRGQAARRAMKTRVDCWTTSRWSSPECQQYRQRMRNQQ